MSMSEKLNQTDLSTPRCREIAAARQAQGIPKSHGWLHLKFNMSTLKRNRAKTGKWTCKHHFSGRPILSFWVCVHVGIFVWVLWLPSWGLFTRMMSKVARTRSPKKSVLATPKRLALTTRTEENLKGYSKKHVWCQCAFEGSCFRIYIAKVLQQYVFPITPTRCVRQHMLITNMSSYMVSKLVPLGSPQKTLWTCNPSPQKNKQSDSLPSRKSWMTMDVHHLHQPLPLKKTDNAATSCGTSLNQLTWASCLFPGRV